MREAKPAPLRITRLRLLLRDVAAGAAVSAIAISGEVPPWALGLFVVGFALALLDIRPFTGRPVVSAPLLVLGAVGLYSQVAAGRVDLVTAACTFAGLVTAHRVLSAPSPRTDVEVFLTGLLCVAGGAALSGDLLFPVFLAAFAVLATVSLGLGIVERHADETSAVPYFALGRLLALGGACALVSGALLFALFPRLSWNVASRRAGRGLGVATTGLSEGVRLGGTGRIRSNPRVVLRARLSPDPGVASLHGYWVGQALDTFNGTEWTSSAPPKPASANITWEDGVRKATTSHVELLAAYGSRTLVALDRPVEFNFGILHTPGADLAARLVEYPSSKVRFEMGAEAYAYNAVSTLYGRDSRPLPTDERARDLMLPARLDARVEALANSVTQAERDPLKKAQRLEAFLQETFRYTVDLPGKVEDPLADFLFGRRAGHCEYFATALTVMLRTCGIPARVVTGFYGGERAQGSYLVRASDAHAWSEAYIDGTGFVRLDATPVRSRGGEPNALLDWLVRAYETLDMRWQSTVMDYSAKDQAAFAVRLTTPWGRTRLPNMPRVGTLAFALLGGAGLYLLAGLFRARERPAEEATKLLSGIERILGHDAQLPIPPAGVEALMRRLNEERHDLGPAVSLATERYLRARFGHSPLRPGERAHVERRLKAACKAYMTLVTCSS
jgi:transglutaminase-like putative cysteine protease